MMGGTQPMLTLPPLEQPPPGAVDDATGKPESTEPRSPLPAPDSAAEDSTGGRHWQLGPDWPFLRYASLTSVAKERI